MSEKAPRADVRINLEWCKACGICVELCPRHVLEMKDGIPVVVKLEECTACNLCELRCPDLAICVVCGKKRVEQAS